MNVQVRIYGKSAYVMLPWKRKVFKFFTGVKIDLSDFDERTGLISPHIPGALMLQQLIDNWRVKLLTTALDLERRGFELSQALLRRQFSIDIATNIVENGTIPELMRRYNDLRRDSLSEPSITKMNFMATVLEYYQTSHNTLLKLSEFTETTAREIQRYLLYERKVNNNTVYSYMGRIHSVLVYFRPESKWAFVRYDVYQPEVVFLYEEEIEQLRRADLNEYQSRTRDLLLFQCYTGMRYSDTQNYSPGWESQGLIIYRQQKTDSEAILPLFAKAKEILERYDGTPPVVSSQRNNFRLKELFRHLNLDRPVSQTYVQGKKKTRTSPPLYEIVSSHIGRKTFIMQALMKGVSIQDVMDMSGHSDYRAMQPYVTRHKAHLKKLGGLWDDEPETKNPPPNQEQV